MSTAPLAAEMKTFIDTVLDVHIADGYGTTEVGAVTRDGVVMRPPVIDYKLVDVPELGYFLTDKPYPRGELSGQDRDDDARATTNAPTSPPRCSTPTVTTAPAT